MSRLLVALIVLTLTVSACSTKSTGTSSGIYRINDGQRIKIQYRMLDSINELRAVTGAQPVKLNSELTASAATHARDIAVQNRPWNFGSNGSSPIDRARKAGYKGEFRGEAISETFETELETLSAWMAQQGSRRVILDPKAKNIGFAWYQEESGKLWWVLETGA